MSVMEMSAGGDPNSPGAWAWWESRRLGYNVALGFAGWAAYGLNAAMYYAVGRPLFETWQGALGMTIFLGTGFLILMGFANIFYLLGIGVESVVSPRDRDGFRRGAYALGLWGSVALPFVFPLANFAFLIGSGALG